MKRTIICILLVLIFSACFVPHVIASNSTILEEENQSDIIAIKNDQNNKIKEYSDKYNSETYGFVAYILNIVRWYSIPVCFFGIILGALNQYVLGTRRLDRRHKGQSLIMTFVTLLVICQVLPLIFTLVVIGWRG